MKFGKQMETAAYNLPENWRPHLIHYKTLKKSIRLVVDELESRGLSTEWINTLDTEEAMKLDYTLSGDTGKPQPCIKITIDDPASIPLSGEPILLKLIPMTQSITTEPLSIKIELVRDSEFFRLLLHELSYAAALHDTEKERFLGIIDGLENQLTVVASPQKDDLCGRQQSSKTSQEQLEWFTQELTRMKLAKKFINKYSKVALTQFLSINAQLVQFKQFQTLNQTAMIKILKKHDKRSGLCATSEFSSFAKDNAVFIESVLSGLFHTIQTKIITIVPQPDDYDCPVCYSTENSKSLRRLYPGSRLEETFQWPFEPIDSLDSSFNVQEYLQQLIRTDNSNIQRLVDPPETVEKDIWQYEHLRQVCLELSLLVVALESECTKQICPEMKADGWLYLCAAHPSTQSCPAIDYIIHTLDGATVLLNNSKYFPSRISIPEPSLKHFQSVARRLYRIFAHAYFHHREIYEFFEVRSNFELEEENK
ncbi:hypothetical protein G6F63_000708 [Rhizopus arrhizus]|nr:hypothetical protein G6F63_000708 [Rhizopus arrhizus]